MELGSEIQNKNMGLGASYVVEAMNVDGETRWQLKEFRDRRRVYFLREKRQTINYSHHSCICNLFSLLSRGIRQGRGCKEHSVNTQFWCQLRLQLCVCKQYSSELSQMVPANEKVTRYSKQSLLFFQWLVNIIRHLFSNKEKLVIYRF